MVRENADIAMAAAPETDDQDHTQIRTQPVFCLMKIELSESLVKFTHAGGRKIDAWTAQHNTVVVAFDAPGDDPLAFANVNTLNELQALENAAP
jgi:molybdopterin-guanine dinucleotide biosynthesis protein A